MKSSPVFKLQAAARVFGKVLTLLLGLLFPALAYADLTTPLSVSNQSPLILVHGLPDMGRSSLLGRGVLEAQITIDLSSHFVQKASAQEVLLLDGESHRYELRLSYGLADRIELGLELPYVNHHPGYLDRFINDWHNVFALPTGGREAAPNNRLRFSYTQAELQQLGLNDKAGGMGDISLRAAWQLKRSDANDPVALALHGRLKLPTGESDTLTGSGGLGLALWLSGAREKKVHWGELALMTSLGVLLLEDGDVLPDQQRSLVAFGGVGIALQPWTRVRLQLQTDFHSSFYDDSRFSSIDSPSLQLAMGGTIILDREVEVELAVTEDIAVDTAPDVIFHLALRKRF